MNNKSKNYPSKEIIDKAKNNIDLALKTLSTESFVALKFLSMAQKRWRNVPTLRLNAKISPLALDINPYFAAILDYKILLSCFYLESIRIALHHCTRSAYPLNAFTLSSEFIGAEQAKSSIPFTKKELKSYFLTENSFSTIDKSEFFLEERVENWKVKKSYDELNSTIFNSHTKNLLNLFNRSKKLNKSDFLTFNDENEALLFYTYPGNITENDELNSSSNSENDSSDDITENDELNSSSNGSEESDEKIHIDGNTAIGETPTNGTANDWVDNDNIEKSIENIAFEAMEAGNNDWGTLTNSEIKQKIIAVNTPKIDQRQILRKFGQSVKSNNLSKTRMKLNRRKNAEFGSVGKRNTYTSKLLFAVDTSGSMLEEVISLGITIACKSLPDAEIKLCYWDTIATEPMDIDNLNRAKEYEGVCGGGGTNPSCVFDMLKKIHSKEHFDGVIIFSDMFFSNPSLEKKKTIWISTTCNNEKENSGCFPTWGTRIDLKDLLMSDDAKYDYSCFK